jgi:beta-lactamase superfamily II metal-dependent hydrolase
MKVTFFNVGQGHCTLFYSWSYPPLLVDCGSTKWPKRGREATFSSIGDCIISMCTNFRQINCVISHMDKDHYNMLMGVVERLHVKAKIIVGGKKEHAKDIEQWKKDTESYTILYMENLIENDEAPDFLNLFPEYKEAEQNNIKFKFLSSAIDKDENKSSIVLDVSCGDYHFWCTGDIEGEEICEIVMRDYVNQKTKCTVLLLPHHGAVYNNSNSTALFLHAAPQYAIVSSGLHERYEHPRFQAIQRVLLSPNLAKNCEAHDIKCFKANYKDHKIFDGTTIQLNEHIIIRNTKFGVFHTHDSGDITFDVNEEGMEISTTFN